VEKRRVVGPWASSVAALVGLVLSLWSEPARADVSSWLFVGAGPSWVEQRSTGTDSQLSLQIETGLGTPPANTVIFGGLFRTHTHFGLGTDLGLMLRTATHGFVNGGFGGALDLGGYQRFWDEGSSGLAGSLVLGAPWGITLSAGGAFGTNEHKSFSAVLGVDFARLTIYRRSGQAWLKNPFPAYRPEDDRRSFD
jgi:hypothetical protein